ncbi:hypothetical protein [Chryseobacterium carnipullorum]|uniref:hypothetical protein n=1 Tax=Chryseobacterium carnipullorum TaxID=1124835 RepID=UPI000FE27552|nr:hypothetical protein [Chryseobacterium carnipullorum]
MDQQARKDQTGPYTPEIVARERREDSLQKAKQIENLKRYTVKIIKNKNVIFCITASYTFFFIF